MHESQPDHFLGSDGVLDRQRIQANTTPSEIDGFHLGAR